MPGRCRCAPTGSGRCCAPRRELRVRRMPTAGPCCRRRGTAGSTATVGPVTAQVRRRMGRDLVAVLPGAARRAAPPHAVLPRLRRRAAHRGAGRERLGRPRRGGRLPEAVRRAGFPLEEMRLVTTADLDAPPTGDGNNTAAYVCRTTRGSTHALGARLRAGDRREPVPEPLPQGRPGAAGAGRAPTSTGPGTARAWCCAAAWSPGRSRPSAGPGAATSLGLGPHALLRERPLSRTPDRPRRDVGWAGHECVVPDPAGPLLDPDRAGARRRDPGDRRPRGGPVAGPVAAGPRTQPGRAAGRAQRAAAGRGRARRARRCWSSPAPARARPGCSPAGSPG